MIRMTIAAAALAAALPSAAMSSAALAQSPPPRVGLLECNVSGGVGLIITSSKALACTFSPARGGGPRERYVGTIRKFGLDVGATTGGKLAWAVFAPTNSWRRGALAGTYGGASAEATAVVGAGANLLVGGFERSISLQPLSVGAQTGINIAAGVSEMQLDPAMRR